jgi:hypothetical protein
MRHRPVPPIVDAPLRSLLPLPELSASDWKRLVINLLIETEHVEILGVAPQPVDVPRDDGSAQRIFRGRRCQVAVFSEYSGPGVWFVRGGTLDDPTGVTPNVHIYTRSKVGWVTLPDGAPAFDGYYDRSQLWPYCAI